MSMIDLSTVTAPQVVEALDFEAIFAQLKAELLARLPGVADVLELESEPLTKLLQVAAYREVLLRQRVNEAARSIMLAYAVGSDLDQIGANFDTARLPGESDARFRQRIQQAYNRLAAAGPANAYRQHALAVSADIADVDVFSEAAGRVTVTVLARELVKKEEAEPEAATVGAVLFGPAPQPTHVYVMQGNDGALLRAVLAALNAEDVRPLTDHVVVRAPTVTLFTVRAVLEILPGPDATAVLARRSAALQTYLKACQVQRTDVTRAGITAALMESGVKDVRLELPATNVAAGQGQLAVCTATTLTHEVVNA